jgi:hypothetical protein
MANRARRSVKQTPSRRPSWLKLAAAVGVLLLVAGGLAIWTSSSRQTTEAPQVTGAPNLVVDRTTVDEGYIKYNVPVRTTFRLSNIGDQALTIKGQPMVQLVEGC